MWNFKKIEKKHPNISYHLVFQKKNAIIKSSNSLVSKDNTAALNSGGI